MELGLHKCLLSWNQVLIRIEGKSELCGAQGGSL